MRDSAAGVGILHQMWASAGVSDADCIESAITDVGLAEQLGYESFWFGEHHFNRDKPFFGRVPVPELLIARLAAATSTIQLGTGVKILPLEEPDRAVESMALLDLLTNGRACFGLGQGAGDLPQLPAGADKKGMFRERLLRLLGYLAGEYDDRPRITPFPDPAIRRRIWIAARDEPAIALTAELGLKFVIGQAERAGAQREFVDIYRAAGGTAEVRSVRLMYVAASDEAAYDDLEGPAGVYFDLLKNGLYYRQAVEQGIFPEELPATMPDLLNRCGFIAGSPETVLAGLRAHRELVGADRLDLLIHVPGLSPEQVRGTMALFAREVMPALVRETAAA